MSKHKKQHYIPECYLKAWCDPNTPENYEPYVWIFSKATYRAKKKAPTNIFYETDLYTIEIDSERDLSIEKSLAQIESDFVAVRRNKLEKHIPLTTNEILVICAFASAMYSRTLASGRRWQPFWEELADKMKIMSQWANNATSKHLESIQIPMPIDTEHSHIVTYDEIKKLADEPLKSLVPAHLEILTPLLFQLDIAIVETSTKPGFITSDDPCVWFDPALHARSFPRGPALISPTIEINLPISPSQCILFNRRGDNGYIFLSTYGPEVDISVVNEGNWRIHHRANESFIVNQNLILSEWIK